MLSLRKNAIDLGIVIKDSNASLAFYRDLLGFEHVADTPQPVHGCRNRPGQRCVSDMFEPE